MALYIPREQQSDEDLFFMRQALDMAQEAHDALEIPVGSVFVRAGTVIAKARNRTNELMNATRHAELEAIDYILSQHPPQHPDFAIAPHSGPLGDNVFADTTLYVTVEPCIMCGSALRQVGIKRVVFGAGNERFGGNGSVLSVHNDPALVTSPPYEAVGGFMREEAIMLLRRFYLTENANAPKPKSKANRTLKTEFQPPGVSMHGPQGQPTKKPVHRNVLPGLRHQTASEGSTGETSRSATPDRVVAASSESPLRPAQQDADAEQSIEERKRIEASSGVEEEAHQQKESIAAQLEALDLGVTQNLARLDQVGLEL